ncbi:MAG: hypothetical protein NXI35_03325 [bacterium]|nr:hypothetical protein [bacterium]
MPIVLGCLVVAGGCFADPAPGEDVSGSSGTGSTGPSSGGASSTSTSGSEVTSSTQTGSETTTTGNVSGPDPSTGSTTTGGPANPPQTHVYDPELGVNVSGMAAHPEGGVIIAGDVWRNDSREAALVHVGLDGEVEWAVHADRPESEQFYSVLVDGDRIVATGVIRYGGPQRSHILVSHFSLQGQHVQSVQLETEGGDLVARAATQTSTGGFVLAGNATDGLTDARGLAVGMSADFDPQWTSVVVGLGAVQLLGVAEEPGGSFAVVGSNQLELGDREAAVARVGAGGDFTGGFSFGSGGVDVLRGVSSLGNDDVIVLGEASSYSPDGSDALAGRLNPVDPESVQLVTVGSDDYDTFYAATTVAGTRVALGQTNGVGSTANVWIRPIDDMLGLRSEGSVFLTPDPQRFRGAAASPGGDTLAIASNIDAMNDNETWDLGLVYTNAQGALDRPCPGAVSDGFEASPVTEVIETQPLTIGAPLVVTRTDLETRDLVFTSFARPRQGDNCGG